VTVKLDQFDYDLVENYYLRNLIENQIWLFGSHSNEETTPTSLNNEFNANEFLKKTLFGIKYSTTDFAFLVPFIDWVENRVYTQYDDKTVLKDSMFYVVIEPIIDGGNYHIFKCISNANGRPSLIKPEFNPSIQNGFYYLNDGYIWKYMTSIPSAVYRKFNARGLLPIVRNSQVEDIANTGIHNIIVENSTSNSGYEKITGFVNSLNISSGITTVFLKSLFSETNNTFPFFEVPNLYIERTIYIQKSPTSSQIGAIQATIRTSGVQSSLPFVTITTPSGFTIEQDDIIQILPRIVIEGTGNGCSAIAVFNEDATLISDIQILNPGNGYEDAIATVIDPIGFDPNNLNRLDIRCVLRPVISPKNGHGFNPISELKCRHIGLSMLVSSVAFMQIPSLGTYSKIGIVKNASFSESFDNDVFDNRIRFEMESLPLNLEVGTVVRQENVSGIIHEIDADNNVIFVSNYDGPYENTFVDSLPLQINDSNFDINTIIYSPYILRSGRVLAISDVNRVQRTEDNSERIKLVLDF
jgi:hypothetical protein